MADAQNPAGGTPGAETTASGMQAGAGQQPQNQGVGETPKSLDEWLDSRDEATQKVVGPLLESYVAGLKSSLKGERDKSSKLEKTVKDLAKNADEGSAQKAQLEKLGLELADTRVERDFLAEAHGKGIASPKLAFLAAKSADLIDDKGRVDFAGLKEQFPELFAAPSRPALPSKAGAGAGTPPPKLSGNAAMNAAIRSLAGIT